ncbi:MAG: GPR endopeptidase [Clostridia bacterium]|nr:GPR endopeptidase [Clostridia bacterium]
MMEKRTDLAVEAHQIYAEDQKVDAVRGVDINEFKKDRVKVTRVNIRTDEGSRALKKPVGDYVTLEIPEYVHETQEHFDMITKTFSEELKRMMPKRNKDSVTLVVGLGNRNITADALGPKVVDGLLVTRHLFDLMPEDIEDGVVPVCALSPGVLGITGIETNEIIKGVVQRVKPDVIIAIDALASRSISRVMTTIQLSNTGIKPGAGVGNERGGLDEETLGVPVIAVGVPTVVDAATMANDTIDMVIENISAHTDKDTSFYKMLQNIDKKEKYHLIDEVLKKSFVNLVVTPKEVDEIIDDLAEIISDGINVCMHSCINTENVSRYN